MFIAKRDRFWLLGGVLAGLVLIAVAWQFVISNQYDRTNSLHSEVSSQQDRATQLRNQNSQLQADNANLPTYKTGLATAQQALPATTGMPDFLRELQKVGVVNGVTVTQLEVQPAVAVAAVKGAAGVSGPVYEITVDIIATGTFDGLNAFIQQVQQDQPRAVLFTSLKDAPGSNAGERQRSGTFEVFVAPSDGTVPVSTS
jgi:Tfp pilus assembly protein PilO